MFFRVWEVDGNGDLDFSILLFIKALKVFAGFCCTFVEYDVGRGTLEVGAGEFGHINLGIIRSDELISSLVRGT